MPFFTIATSPFRGQNTVPYSLYVTSCKLAGLTQSRGRKKWRFFARCIPVISHVHTQNVASRNSTRSLKTPSRREVCRDSSTSVFHRSAMLLEGEELENAGRCRIFRLRGANEQKYPVSGTVSAMRCRPLRVALTHRTVSALYDSVSISGGRADPDADLASTACVGGMDDCDSHNSRFSHWKIATLQGSIHRSLDELSGDKFHLRPTSDGQFLRQVSLLLLPRMLHYISLDFVEIRREPSFG